MMKVGDQVRRIGAANSPLVPVGAEGTIRDIRSSDDGELVYVTWDGCAREANDLGNYRYRLELVLPQTPIPDKEHGSEFTIKDSGERATFASGMVRDTSAGKIQYHRVLEGPMFHRWAVHLTKGAVKYPDNEDGTANWTKASGTAELRRFKESAVRHFIDWMNNVTDEDHAAAVLFNINGAEYVKQRLKD